MVKKKENLLYFVEGETETALLNALTILGKKQKLNLWEQDVSRFVRRIKPDTSIYILYDTDVLHQYRRFIDNLKKLDTEKNVANIFLLQQTENLEDEVAFACTISSRNKLFRAFNTQDATEFKSVFIKTNNLLERLNKLKLNPEKLWQGEHLVELSSYKKWRSSYQKLEKKK